MERKSIYVKIYENDITEEELMVNTSDVVDCDDERE